MNKIMISISLLLSLIFSLNFSLMTATSSTFQSVKMKKFPCESNLNYNFLNIERFRDNMCAQCLWYMAGNSGPWLNFTYVNELKVFYNYSDTINVLICFDPIDCHEFKYEQLLLPNNYIRNELRSDFYMDLLLDCCEQSRQCCEKMLKNHENDINITSHSNINESNNNNDDCPAKWDGFMCWNSAKPGTINRQTCPTMTYFTLETKPTECRNELARKECLHNSTWSKIYKPYLFNETSQKWIYDWEEYTDYLSCSTPGATLKLKFVRIQIFIYIISLILTTIGAMLMYFFSAKQHRKLREIHLNFFISLILTAVFSLFVSIFIKYQHYNFNSMIDKNPIWCRILMLLMKFARLSNYCWMLQEGIILWQIVVHPLPRNKIRMMKFYLLGWILPIMIIVTYAVIHSFDQFDKSCWTKSMGYWELIYNMPIIIFIIINTILLICMMYKLFRNLTYNSTSINAKTLRTNVFKSLLLVPVFGIHYIFYIKPFDPFESCETYQFILYYVKIIIEALQGSIVTAVFCFFNKEIRNNIQRKLMNYYNNHFYNQKNSNRNHSFVYSNDNRLNSTTLTTIVNDDNNYDADDDDDCYHNQIEMEKLNQENLLTE